jgi:ribonuclease HI
VAKEPLVINCDGLCEPNPGGIATFGWIARQCGEEIHSHNAFVRSGEGATNNLAEYSAVISALEWLLGSKYSGQRLVVRTDSQLVINQINGIYAVRSQAIIPLYHRAIGLVRCFKNLKLEWVPREQNDEADALSQKAYKLVMKARNQTRETRARELAPRVVPLSNGIYKVPSQTYQDVTYRVDIGRNTCTCPDFMARGRKIGYCKHILAVRMSMGADLAVAL